MRKSDVVEGARYVYRKLGVIPEETAYVYRQLSYLEHHRGRPEAERNQNIYAHQMSIVEITSTSAPAGSNGPQVKGHVLVRRGCDWVIPDGSEETLLECSRLIYDGQSVIDQAAAQHASNTRNLDRITDQLDALGIEHTGKIRFAPQTYAYDRLQIDRPLIVDLLLAIDRIPARHRRALVEQSITGPYSWHFDAHTLAVMLTDNSEDDTDIVADDLAEALFA